ncbi:hypothetical protein QT381_11645 [Galbitalea sp. SE-J8]|nr:hypothetical protein [Galbitalea sp. SE-J8]MDM4763661.1 hypothetical protein [Galbitalea sp. SE-J8]
MLEPDLAHVVDELVVPGRIGDGQQRRVQERFDALLVAGDREGAGVGEDVRVDLSPVDDPARLAGEVIEEHELAARVHVAERMQGRRLAPYPGEPGGEGIAVQAGQPLLVGEAAENPVGLVGDGLEPRVGQAGASRAGIRVAQLSAPGVEVLGQVPVDRAKVVEVEVAGQRPVRELGHAQLHGRGLGLLPGDGIAVAAEVDKHLAVRVGVVVRHPRLESAGPGSAADAVDSVDVREPLRHGLVSGDAVLEDGAGGVHVGLGRLGAGHPLPGGDRREVALHTRCRRLPHGHHATSLSPVRMLRFYPPGPTSARWC